MCPSRYFFISSFISKKWRSLFVLLLIRLKILLVEKRSLTSWIELLCLSTKSHCVYYISNNTCNSRTSFLFDAAIGGCRQPFHRRALDRQSCKLEFCLYLSAKAKSSSELLDNTQAANENSSCAISMKGRTQAETAIITNEKITKNWSTTENANSNHRNIHRVENWLKFLTWTASQIKTIWSKCEFLTAIVVSLCCVNSWQVSRNTRRRRISEQRNVSNKKFKEINK